MTFDWKILEMTLDGQRIKSVRYHVTLTDGLSVETEGYWTFRKHYEMGENVGEHQVAHWLDLDTTQDDRHLIKSRLQEQLDALKSAPSTKPPWAVDTFKVTI